MYEDLNSLPASDGRIKDLIVRSYLIPTDAPESDGTFVWDKTIMVTVTVFSGNDHGFGYTYADLSTARLINDNLKDLIIGKSVFANTGLWADMNRKVRNLGAAGVSSMAISAVDIALWDLKARILKVPLVFLLGINKNETAVYGSGGFTSYSDEQMTRQFEGWLDEGISMFKMKIGRNKENDFERIRLARSVIGNHNLLFIDANGAYYPAEAVKYIHHFEKHKISWFEEPVSSDDLAGLAFVRSHMPAGVDVAAGEYGYTTYYFNDMLAAGAVDVLQADATRCGGITGFLRANALCSAFHSPLSAHTAPTIHMHACCAAENAIHIEYFHDHARIEQMFFDGFIEPQNGMLGPDPGRPGLGVEFKNKDAEKYLLH